jgi:putative photosynthetic complex assembly protein 2
MRSPSSWWPPSSSGLTWGAENQWGLWTYLVLWGMHLSARLNVFLGVRNVSEEFVPAHMEVLKSFLTRKPMNLLFPFSVTAAPSARCCLFHGCVFGASPAMTWLAFACLRVGDAGVLEHWLLMLPLPWSGSGTGALPP